MPPFPLPLLTSVAPSIASLPDTRLFPLCPRFWHTLMPLLQEALQVEAKEMTTKYTEARKRSDQLERDLKLAMQVLASRRCLVAIL